ncbi:MAG: ABC transporter permease [Thermoleophilaceae bacterium]
MSTVRLAGQQIRYATISYLRNPPAVFFGLLLPVLFLLIFAAVFGSGTVEGYGGIKQSAYYVPGLIALGIVSTTFVNLALGMVVLRENRVLKRLRGTPLPAPAFIAGRVATAVGMAVALTVVLLLVGRLLYGVDIPGATLPALVLALVVGATAFCCLGVAFSTLVPNEDAGPALVNAAVLPLYFISGVFFPTDKAPAWLNDIASVFPVKHLADALLKAFDPRTTGAGIAWGDLGIVAGWGALGLVAAVLTFRWTPKGE